MLSIDESIALVKIENECIKRAENCNRKCNECDLVQNTDTLLDLYEQLAEWLEELKALREEKSDFQIYAKDIAEANYEFGMEIGYKKAIDDAKSVILQTLDNEILVDTLHLRLEQLKERTENGIWSSYCS